jgi:DNA-binding winged helix-turn-helix (wHTH) protein
LEASVTRLRSKLAQADAAESRIVTVRGIGYEYRQDPRSGHRAAGAANRSSALH